MDEWKPSTGIGSVALALFVTAVTALVGVRHEMAWYAYLFGMVACGTLAFVHLGGAGVRAYLGIVTWLDGRPKTPDAPVAATIPAPAPQPEIDHEAAAWQIALTTFFLAGQKAGGFSIDKLAGCVGSDTWKALTDFYCSEAGGRVLQVRQGNVGTIWNNGQGVDHVMLALRGGRLPFPPGPVPDIHPLPDSATQRNAPRKSKAQPRVIENAAKAD